MFKIVADSSCDLTDSMKKEMNIETVPLKLRLGEKEYTDDENLNVSQYIKDMNDFPRHPETSCPSPAEFIKKYRVNEDVFVVTLSSKLSGTYQSAVAAKNILIEEIGDKFIHVFDSMSASVGETLICRRINELKKSGMQNSEVVDKVNEYIDNMKTFFLLKSLEHLSKAGRLNPIIAKIASILEIKPIMGSSNGNIKLFEKIRGYKKAFSRFIEMIGEQGIDLENRVLGIAHCNCLDMAVKFKEEVQKRYNFKEIIIVEMAGLSSTYADDGGLVIAF